MKKRTRNFLLSGSLPIKPIGSGLIVLLLLAACGPSESDVRRVVQEELSNAWQRSYIRTARTIGPYSPAVRVGNLLFVSGQVGIDPETGVLQDGSIETETRQVMENLLRIARAEGFDSSHVVSVTVYVRNMKDFTRMNLIYGGYFAEDRYPARATVEVSALPGNANVEMSLIAHK
jgi:2-iminobutanoate/2-iminopropanoate deaminase